MELVSFLELARNSSAPWGYRFRQLPPATLVAGHHLVRPTSLNLLNLLGWEDVSESKGSLNTSVSNEPLAHYLVGAAA